MPSEKNSVTPPPWQLRGRKRGEQVRKTSAALVRVGRAVLDFEPNSPEVDHEKFVAKEITTPRQPKRKPQLPKGVTQKELL